MAGARDTSRFGAPNSTFRDMHACKGSVLFYVEMQFSWQVVIVEELRFRDKCSESSLLDMWLVCSFRSRHSAL